MSKRMPCPFGCKKTIKNRWTHKSHCRALNSSLNTSLNTSKHTSVNSSVKTSEEPTTPSINTEKDAFLSGETHTFQELTNEWNKVKDELKVSDDELLPQKTAENTGVVTSAVDGAQLKSYEVLANSLHQSVNDFIIFATKGRMRMQKEQLERLNECGAQVLHKYDKNGKVAQYVPELAYVLTLTDVVAQVLLVMKKDEVKNGGTKDNSGTIGREGQTNQGVTGAS